MSDGSGCHAGGHDCGLPHGTYGEGPVTDARERVHPAVATRPMINGAPVIDTSHEFVLRQAAATPSNVSRGANGS